MIVSGRKKEDNTENGLHFGYLGLFRFTLVMKW